MAKPNLVFYCQHLLGVGHLTRSFAIVDSLVSDFDVTFLQGGPEIGRRPNTLVKLHCLTPIQMRENDSSLYDPEGERSARELFAQRAKEISAALPKNIDILVIELFPFGRKKFRTELVQLIELVKRVSPKVKVVCSLRDILVEKDDYLARDRRTAEIVTTFFDYVCVHSDPEVIRIEDTFSAYDQIADKVHYTGFVCENRSRMDSALRESAKKSPRILVSQGGGMVGRELLEAVAKVVPAMPQYDFLFTLGPNAPSDLGDTLKAITADAPNFQLEKFIVDFEAAVASSVLSISLAGYNTTMNFLNQKARALVFPYDANREQRMRAKALERLGFLRVIEREDLAPERIRQHIEAQLQSAYPEHHLGLDGATQTRDFLLSI